MTDSFGALKRNRTEGFEKLTQSLNKLNQKTQGGNGPDERFWKPEVDKAGNGYAVIRFLPESEGEDVPFVRIWLHGLFATAAFCAVFAPRCQYVHGQMYGL